MARSVRGPLALFWWFLLVFSILSVLFFLPLGVEIHQVILQWGVYCCLVFWAWCTLITGITVKCKNPTAFCATMFNSFLHPTCAVWKMYVPVLIVHCHFQLLRFFPLKRSTFVAMETMMLLRVTCNIEAEIVCFGVLFSFSSGLKHYLWTARIFIVISVIS